MRSLAVAAAAAVAIAAAVALVALFGGGESSGEPVVAVTFPGLSDDVTLLLEGCRVRVETIAPPGVDPHTYSLEPAKEALVRRAVLVVSTGHAPFEARIAQIVEPDRLVVVPETPGLRLLRTPTGAVNLHMPIYDPGNYAVFISYLAERLSRALPECSSVISANAEGLAARAEALLNEYQGVLGGVEAVASGPAAQYAVSWLGANIKVMLVSEHGVQADPRAVSEAEEILARGGVAVVVVGPDGSPVSKAGEWLYRTARDSGAPVLRVPAPYTPGPIIEKIEQVAAQAEAIASGAG